MPRPPQLPTWRRRQGRSEAHAWLRLSRVLAVPGAPRPSSAGWWPRRWRWSRRRPSSPVVGASGATFGTSHRSTPFHSIDGRPKGGRRKRTQTHAPASCPCPWGRTTSGGSATRSAPPGCWTVVCVACVCVSGARVPEARREGRPSSHQNLPPPITPVDSPNTTCLLCLQPLQAGLGLLLPQDDEGPAILVKDQRHPAAGLGGCCDLFHG